MKHWLRPYISLGLVALVGMALAPSSAPAQSRDIVELLQGSSPLLHSGSQGYLGVDVADVDNEKAQALKLKEVRGAIITLIDHDAPAGKKGLKVNDVVLQLNGQTVEGAEQLRRMLREIPAGRNVSLLISRDGNVQTLAVELADRKVMEHDIWSKIGSGGDIFAGAPGMGILSGGGDASLPGAFHMPFFGSTLNVGAMVEPLTSQMAEYLGVPSGLMVKQVAHKSEAAAAGLKAFDVILKVGPEPINTLADWERALHANQGKPVAVTILRDRKQQTVSLQVDSKRHGKLIIEDIFPNGDCPLVAELGPEFAASAQAAAQTLRNQLNSGDLGSFTVTPEQAVQMRRQAQKLRDSINAEDLKPEDFKLDDFKLDPKQLDQINQQMEEFRKTFKHEDLKLDQKQLDQIRQQMEEFRKAFKPEDFKLDQKQVDEMKKQMEQLKQQMKEWNLEGFDGHA